LELGMNIDRRIYLSTIVAALILGGAILSTVPHDPLTASATVHVGDGARPSAALRHDATTGMAQNAAHGRAARLPAQRIAAQGV